jgi:hypothetical protein
MIKLRSLIREDNHKSMPDSSLANYILQNKVVTISDWLYHGSPYEGLQSMLVKGIWGVEHREVAEYDTISTSINSEVLDYFSEKEGTTGLQFKIDNAKVVVLDEILIYLVTQLPGSGFDAQIEDEVKFEDFCEKFHIPSDNRKGTPYLPYNYLSSLGVDAFTFDYVWNNYKRGRMPFRDESEFCFIGKQGMELLNRTISDIWVDGIEFDLSHKKEALLAIQRKI